MLITMDSLTDIYKIYKIYNIKRDRKCDSLLRTTTLYIYTVRLVKSMNKTYSVAQLNFMPTKEGLKVSVYISIPVPLR